MLNFYTKIVFFLLFKFKCNIIVLKLKKLNKPITFCFINYLHFNKLDYYDVWLEKYLKI